MTTPPSSAVGVGQEGLDTPPHSPTLGKEAPPPLGEFIVSHFLFPRETRSPRASLPISPTPRRGLVYQGQDLTRSSLLNRLTHSTELASPSPSPTRPSSSSRASRRATLPPEAPRPLLIASSSRRSCSRARSRWTTRTRTSRGRSSASSSISRRSTRWSESCLRSWGASFFFPSPFGTRG